MDPDGRVCEATGENVFLVKDGAVVAVSHPDALLGITRDTVMQLADATERAVYLPELLDADEVFLTGTSAEVAPVTRIDDTEFPIGPVTRHLQGLYQDLVHGRLPGYALVDAGDIMSDLTAVTLSDVHAASRRIRPHLPTTPMVYSAARSSWLKLRAFKKTGAYKVRGALNALFCQVERGTVDPSSRRLRATIGGGCGLGRTT